MYKVGFIINRLAGSQASFYLTQYMNQAIAMLGYEIIVFQEMPVMPDLPFNGAIMQVQDAFSFNGPLIATRFNSAIKLANFPGTREKFFYVWDLEWTRLQNKSYSMLAQVYRNPAYKLIARSKDHASIITQCWNVPVVGIVDDFNIEEFVRIIDEQRNK